MHVRESGNRIIVIPELITSWPQLVPLFMALLLWTDIVRKGILLLFLCSWEYSHVNPVDEWFALQIQEGVKYPW